jgi:cystathionine beta-lyase/cystathionine gamma-synthase
MTTARTRTSRLLTGPLPCGARIPGSIHSVSVSLPTLQDLVGYEERDAATLARVPTGYPRFHTHPYVARLQQLAAARAGMGGGECVLLASRRAAAALCEFAGLNGGASVASFEDLFLLRLPDDPDAGQKARSFVQHTGSGISSRRAEDMLIALGLLSEREPEESWDGDAWSQLRTTLATAYGAAGPEDVHLASFGMNAIYGIYAALGRVQQARRRGEWIRFGWLFMDTIQVLRKLPAAGAANHALASSQDLAGLTAILDQRGDRVAGIVTEAPSNPLLQTPDLARLRDLADRHGCALVVDATLGTPYNVDVLPYADVVVESLTKYASGSADIMMGAVVLNRSSPFYGELQALLPGILHAPYWRDVARMALRVSGYAERMQAVNGNTLALAEFLRGRQSVKSVRWAYQEGSRASYEQIQRGPERPGGLITLELNRPLAAVYDRLQLAKGPSLGAEFTLVGPYLYHAHYDLVSREEGRQLLRRNGLDPELLRISVGTEETDYLVQALADAL